jgi:uncharacterized repeat protein (TIGR01451 family)/fimbrial isopeptide formation D2 family protein
LPYAGDGRGTDIDGGYTVTGVTAVAGATVYYTTVDPSTLSNDPRDPSNGGTPGTVPAGTDAGWTTTMPASPTAIRVIGPALAPGASQQIRIAFDTPAGSSCTDPAATDNKPGQKLVNTADSIAGHTALPMLSSATTAIGDCYAMDMKKYVLEKGGDDTGTPGDPASDWHDANSAADYPVYLVGDTVEYAVVVTNKGTGTLTDIAVSDPLATGCDTVIDTLAAGASATVTCTLTAVAGATVNTATASVTPPDGPPLTPQDPAGVNVPEPFVVQKVSDPASGGAVDAGDPVTYTITVTEPDSSVVGYPAPSLSDDLSAVLDDGVYAGDVTTTYSVGTGPDAVVDTDAQTLTWGADFLAPGQVVTITYTIDTFNPVAGDMDLANPVTTPPGQSNCSSPTQDPRCTTDLKVWSLHVEKSADVATAKPGDTVTYTITATNNGTADFDSSHPATLSDPLTGVLDDAAIDPASITADVGAATYDEATKTLSWTSDPDGLAVGGAVVISYTVTVNSPVSGDLELHNPVVGGQCTVDSTDPDCHADVLVQIYHVAKTADKDVTNPGDVVTYTIVVTNTGKVAYTEDAPASFTDDLTEVLDDASAPAGITGGATYDEATGTLSWSGPLAVGGTATISYQVTVNRPNDGDNVLHNVVGTPPEANCGPDSTDPACVVDVPVRSFHVTKTADTAEVIPGETITYTITVANTGKVDYTADDPASFTDDLTGVLDDAAYNGDADSGAT